MPQGVKLPFFRDSGTELLDIEAGTGGHRIPAMRRNVSGIARCHEHFAKALSKAVETGLAEAKKKPVAAIAALDTVAALVYTVAHH